MRAALRGLAMARPATVVLAVPVAPAETAAALRMLCDAVICLTSPVPFHAVGAHYQDFSQTADAEVIRLLAAARTWRTDGNAGR